MVRRSNNSRTAQSTRNQSQALLHQDLKKLIELQGSQMVKFIPETMDVPRLRFKSNRTFNVELSYRTTVVSNNTAVTLGALSISLSQSPLAGNYTSVFDQYRILQVNVKIMPFQTAAFNPAPGAGAFIYTALDYDDNNPPSGIDTLLSYDSLKITPGGQIDERTFVPHAAVAAYGGATFSAYAQAPSSMFIDSASPGAAYYGLKYALSTSPQPENINFIVTMAVQFRNPRAS